MEKWYRFLGVRPSETRTVWLFFAHNFLLGIGTILVYMAANVLLLAGHAERNLPLAYCVGAVAVVVVGRIYAHYEHRLRVRTLAARVLLVTVVLALVLGLALLRGPSVPTAVGIMAGYRLIYLLTNLEFWDLSSAVFNVRQGRRLSSVISAGDMPAKALGAGLTIFVHASTTLYALLFTASAFYLLALFSQRAILRAQGVAARPGAVREPGKPQLPLFRQFFGASPLVRSMGLSLTAIATVAVGVEYLFFVNVKYKLQEQTHILHYVGGVLALTFLLALLFKLAFSRHALDRLGVRWTLTLLPLLALAGVLLFGVLQTAHVGPATLMAYFAGLYLVLEVLRRAVFEPVFLVLLQPLAAPERLEGHTLVKGFYEPLGLGLGGLLLLGLPQLPALNLWGPFGWMAALLLGAVFLLQRTYWTYIDELKRTLGLRFSSEASPDLGLNFPAASEPNGNRISPKEAIQAIDYLHKAESATVVMHAEHLLRHTDSRVRHRVLSVVGPSADVVLLRRLALADPDPALRETASALASRHAEASDLLAHPDLAVRKGAIRGRLETAPADAPARASLAAIVTSNETSSRLAALALVDLLTPEQQVELVTTSLCHPEPTVVSAAVQAAVGASSQALMEQLVALLRVKAVQKSATTGLVKIGAATLPLLKQALAQETDSHGFRSLAQVCAQLATPAARQLLVDLAQRPNLIGRAVALRALSSFASVSADTPLFQRLVEEEMRLAQHLLHGMVAANAELRAALHYELRRGQQRLFGLLAQVYERQPILDAQRGVAHTSGERQANALEMLDNLIPRPLYHGLQAMLDVGRLRDKVRKFDDLLGPTKASESIQTVIVRGGTAAFSIWTISLALQQWHPQPNTVAYLYPHLQSPNLLIQENASAVLRQLPIQRPAAYDQLISLFPSVATMLMSPQSPTSSVSARERVLMLKGTTLFAETPENVLSTIMPIMKEVAFQPEQQIFVKGTLGTSLFIISEGEVGIFDGHRHLTTFRKGEFFGELALLDAEARSATALAMCPVVAFRIDQEDFYDVMEECPEVVRNVMRVLCQRLRRQNERMQSTMPAET